MLKGPSAEAPALVGRHVRKGDGEIREGRTTPPGHGEPADVAEPTPEDARRGGRDPPDEADEGVDG
jgi:hypothetical protein